ncbi:hypothetical protein EMIT0111MI5_90254 [Burkholderia sp. IT-111MI5]
MLSNCCCFLLRKCVMNAGRLYSAGALKLAAAVPPRKAVAGRIVTPEILEFRPLDIISENEMQYGVYGLHNNMSTANKNTNNYQCFWAKQKICS